MTEVRPSLSCQRVREQVSLLLDDELSQLEPKTPGDLSACHLPLSRDEVETIAAVGEQAA